MNKNHMPGERAICNAVAVFRERGNYLQRIEQFEKAIQAYDEALRWNSADVRSLLGRSLARVKSTHYAGALADAAQATELEPENLKAMQLRAQAEYEKCAFERSLLLAHRGLHVTRFPPEFAECAKFGEETVQEISLADKMRSEQISRLMASKYLERMAHDKYFLTSLCKDERLTSANKQGSQALFELANKALADVEQRQVVLRERRPLYAARAAEVAARARLSHTRKEQLKHTKRQYVKDAKRLIQAAQAMYEEHDTAKCLEQAEFGMEQISRKPAILLPGKDKFLQQLQDIVANAFLDQKRVRAAMSESDREKRAFILLGIFVSREPSRDSVLRVRPQAPRRDARRRIRTLERALSLSVRESERCYLLHELARLHVDIKQCLPARFYATKCQAEARTANQSAWLLNASFLLARCHLLQNNRPEARAVLLEAANFARFHGHIDIAEFYDTCVNIALEGEVGTTEEPLEKREKDMLSLMQDDDLRSEAQHLFKRMSVMPAARRFSIMPGARVERTVPQSAAKKRMSIVPNVQQPTRVKHKIQLPLGFQDFDN